MKSDGKLRDRDTDRDSKLVWGASAQIDKHPGEETSETKTGKQFLDRKSPWVAQIEKWTIRESEKRDRGRGSGHSKSHFLVSRWEVNLCWKTERRWQEGVWVGLWDSRCVFSSVNKVNKSGLIRLFLIPSQWRICETPQHKASSCGTWIPPNYLCVYMCYSCE